MTWNYRVMVREGQYAIYSVYYADDGRITTFGAEPMPPCSDGLDGLADDLNGIAAP